MLPVAITDEAALARVNAEAEAGREVEVDLPNQVIRAADGTELATFDVEEFRKHCLVNGLDDIGLTMQMEDKIEKFEEKRTAEWPWLDGSGYLARYRNGPVKIKAAKIPTTNRGLEKEITEW